MENMFASIFIIAVVLCIYLCYQLHQYVKAKKLKKLVAWCTMDDSQKFRGGLKLYQHVNNAQLHNVATEYHIHGETEWEFTNEILFSYAKYLAEQYFDDRLYIPKSKYVVRGEDYFMFTLCDYLSMHECDYEFCGHSMREKTLSFKNHGMWGGPLFDAKFALSDFAIVYHKLYYISYMFCKSSPILNQTGGSYRSDDELRTILDTKQIEISRV